MKNVHIPMTRQARDALIAISVLWVVCAIVVVFRVVGRFRGAGISFDDVLSFLALLLSSTTIGLNASVFTSGVGINFDPTAEVYPKLLTNMSHILLMTFTFTLIYLWTLACLKLSQLYLYWRVFSTHLRLWIFAGAAIVITWAIIFTFIFIFLCTPIQQQWSLMRIGHCMDQIFVLKSLIMTNILTDVFIFVLPIRSVWKLNMRKTEKLAVISCFALGAACVVIGIVRFWEIFVIDLIGNLTGTSLTTFMLCSIELMLAGLCINIPTLRPFYLQWRAKSKSYATGSNDHYDSGFKSSGSKSARGHPLTGGQQGQGHSTWIELDDKDQETIHDGDADSERRLTTKQPDAIVVSKNWSVT